MIRFITGANGSGKSLALVGIIREALAEGRHVVICGVEGLVLPGCQDEEYGFDWRKTPEGSLIVIDECWQQWRLGARGDDIDQLRMHRHQGYDFYLVTQSPYDLHKDIRGLVSEHRHYENVYGLGRARVRVSQGYNAFSGCTGHQKEMCKYSKEDYKLYRSATAHTRKINLPPRLVMIGSMFLLLCVGVLWAVGRLADAGGLIVQGSGPGASDVAVDKLSVPSQTAAADEVPAPAAIPEYQGGFDDVDFSDPEWASDPVSTDPPGDVIDPAVPVLTGLIYTADRCVAYYTTAAMGLPPSPVSGSDCWALVREHDLH